MRIEKIKELYNDKNDGSRVWNGENSIENNDDSALAHTLSL